MCLGIPACGDPGDPINGSRMPSDRSTFLESDVVEFSCDLGHVIDGPEVITCLPSGTWDFAKPMCEGKLHAFIPNQKNTLMSPADEEPHNNVKPSGHMYKLLTIVI